MTRTGPARRNGAGAALRHTGTAAALLWFAVPLAPLLLWAAAEQWRYPDVLPATWGAGPWKAALDQGAGSALLASTGVSVAVAVVATPIGAAAGRVLAARAAGGQLAGAVLAVPVAVPPFAVVLGLSTIALQLRLAPAAAVVGVLVVAALPYTTFVMRAAYAGYDTDVEEAAATLGASTAFAVRHVRVPLLAPALATSAFLAFLVGWSDYVVTLVLGGGQLVTLPMLVAGLAAASGNDPVVAATSLAALVPPLVLLAVVAAWARRGAVR